ncbi:unnamed protein product [Lepeophtheirus salmonis]|uniref:(salmon louse) hypothetical protein n=1 Tax=Lepeophtheirus salmonis TaxID=72036 RepID=A0A7R8CL90_LEPSM|nr:unnamed protein product [Lepeophtheirus salmonis]CAF2820892.1 unnamed protein product [Lepeophtheirus salmonis]
MLILASGSNENLLAELAKPMEEIGDTWKEWTVVEDQHEVLFYIKFGEVKSAKRIEINHWKENKVFEEVEDHGERTISTRWMVTEKMIERFENVSNFTCYADAPFANIKNSGSEMGNCVMIEDKKRRDTSNCLEVILKTDCKCLKESLQTNVASRGQEIEDLDCNAEGDDGKIGNKES